MRSDHVAQVDAAHVITHFRFMPFDYMMLPPKTPAQRRREREEFNAALRAQKRKAEAKRKAKWDKIRNDFARARAA